MTSTIYINNTLTNKKEKLTPILPGKISIYACGVTVYDDCHIGHAMQAIYFDIIRNYLQFRGYDVNYVRNYTDVDDKIIARAKEKGISPKKLANDMIESCNKDMAHLKIADANHQPKVSECIPDIIEMIKVLIAKEHAYPTKNGDVYFNVKSHKDYGKLSNRKVDELKSGTRNLSGSLKINTNDFALWKNDNTPDASWNSPWGVGRPGWHIECSVMAKKFLGNSFDIHGGGRDLIFPHHENEIAQSESANCCSYANIWLHSGLLTINQQKMSKSLGNHIRIKDFIKNWDPEVLRLSYIQNHYSSNIDFNENVFKNSRKRLYYYYQTLKHLDEKSADGKVSESFMQDILSFENNFHRAMSDDFNTAQALGETNKFVKLANKLLQKPNAENFKKYFLISKVLKNFGKILGLFQQDPQNFLIKNNETILKDLNISIEEIEDLIQERMTARKLKQWNTSDQIRDTLLSKGIVLQDNPDKTTWLLKDVLD